MSRAHFEVRWAESAVRDLEDIAAYIAATSSGDALAVVNRLSKQAESLVRLPARGRVVPELLQFGLKEWRELLSGPYRVIYRIDGSTVFVLAVLDGRRDLEDLLLERLVR